MRRESTEIPACKISYSQKPTFWSSPSESGQQWLECRHLKSILAESWQWLKAHNDTAFVVCPCLIQISSRGGRDLPLEVRLSRATKCRWSHSDYTAIIVSLVSWKGQKLLFLQERGDHFPTCVDLEDSVILVTYLILSRGHSVPLAHPSAEIASGWSDYRLCLARFGPKASGHFQFPPGGSHLQI